MLFERKLPENSGATTFKPSEKKKSSVKENPLFLSLTEPNGLDYFHQINYQHVFTVRLHLHETLFSASINLPNKQSDSNEHR